MAEVLEQKEIENALSGRPGWRYENNAISKQFQFPDFGGSMNFVNRVAQLAEAANHHPDITITYNKVLMVLSSHDAGGVTQRDLNLAAQIESAGSGAAT